MNEKFIVTGGIRFDFMLNNIKEHIQPPSLLVTESVVRNNSFEKKYSNFSGAIGFCWTASDQITIKTNIGKTFKMPTVPELAANGVHHGTFRHEKGDVNLTPEHGYQFDFNFNLKNQFVKLNINPFFNYYQNFIYLSPTGSFSTFLESGQLYKYSQVNAIYTGFETDFDFKFSNKLNLNLNSEYVYNYNLENGLGLPFTPPTTVFIEPEYRIEKLGKFNNLNVSLTSQIVSSQNRTDRNEKSTIGYQLFHLKLSTDLMISKYKLGFGFHINNIANKKYLNHLSRYRLLNLPEQGRNLVFQLRLEF